MVVYRSSWATMSLEERVREQAEKVRKIKAEKAPKDQVRIILEEWLSWQRPVVHKWLIEKYCCSCSVYACSEGSTFT